MLEAQHLQIAAALGAALFAAAAARAESEIRIPYPAAFGTIPAATYDEDHQRVGSAHLVIEKLESGNVRILSESGIDQGARTIASAELAPVDSGRLLQLLTEESRSFDRDGTSLGVLRINHRSASASCTSPNGSGDTKQQIALPASDRVVNVPLNLLFLPLVRGDLETVNFQFFMCRGGPRLLDFEARVAARNGSNGGPNLVEVRYGPDFGAIVSLIAQGLIPQLSFWFDPDARGAWIAHRLPLYSKGPEVFVIRDGVSATWLR
jgi:hypothetical protein